MTGVKTRGSVDKIKNNLSDNKTFTEIWQNSKNALSKSDAVKQFKGFVKQYETNQAVFTNRLPASVLNQLENLANDEERIVRLERILLDNGFDAEIHYSSQNNITIFYTKENIDTVFCVLLDLEDVKMTIIDKDVFLEMARDTNSNTKTFSLTINTEKEIHTYSSGKPCPVYHLAFDISKYPKNTGVDHVTGHIGINILEYLRVCTNAENNLNKRPHLDANTNYPLYINEYKNSCQFSVDRKRISDLDWQYLKGRGYKKKITKIVSPKFDSKKEWLQEIDMVTKMAKSIFDYNPLVDFKDTWYALVLHKLFPNNISRQDVEGYNRGYFRRNYKNIARVYGL